MLENVHHSVKPKFVYIAQYIYFKLIKVDKYLLKKINSKYNIFNDITELYIHVVVNKISKQSNLLLVDFYDYCYQVDGKRS